MPNTWKMVQTPLREMFQEELQAYENKFVVSKNWAQNRLYIKAKAQKAKLPVSKVSVSKDIKTPLVVKTASNRPLAPKNKTSTNNFAKTLIVVDFCMAMLIGMILHSAWVEPIQSGVVKANISPVTFTKEELEAFFAPRKAEAKAIVSTPKSEVTELIKKHFGDDADKAIICFKSESGLRASAFNGKNKNGTWDSGIAQVNSIHCPKIGLKTGSKECKDALFDVETNLTVAKKIFDGREHGFRAWYGSGCKQFYSLKTK